MKNIEQLESVQKFALKICAHCWDINYLGLLDMFNISNLETRRIYLRLTTFHKVVNGSFYFPPDTHLQYSPVRATQQSAKYQNSFKIPFARTLSFQSSFILNTIHLWNNLGVEYTNTSFNEFKYILRNLLL